MIIRTGRADEAEALLALWRLADALPSVSDDVESIERLVDRQPEGLLVAEADDGTLVGSLIATFDGWRASMYRLAVHPDRRRAGLAADLVAEGERRLRAQGARRVQAIVYEEHEHAVGFWRAAAYRRHDAVARYTRDLHLDADESRTRPPEC